ncbi:MAG TPA: MopE-related protein, partial [Polyangiaceae bacterium]|nr:MopE-related protein [Polyangiaceae bacterium]
MSRQVGRWAVAASVAFGVIAGAGAAGANPMVMYYRWHDDPTDVDGGHLRYCDWNLVSNTTPPSFDCVPNILINSDPGDGMDSPIYEIPDPFGGIGSTDLDGDGLSEFVALTRDNAFGAYVVGGKLVQYNQSFADYKLSVPFPVLDDFISPHLDAVGFGVGRMDTDPYLDMVVAHTTDGTDLRVSFFTPDNPNPVDERVLAMPAPFSIVDRESPLSDFLGFTVADEDGDHVDELAVLHSAAVPGANEVRISFFDKQGQFRRTLTLASDPLAAAIALSSQPVTLVSGFTRHSIQTCGNKEWLIGTFGHTPDNHSDGGPVLEVKLWRYDDSGAFIGMQPVSGSGVPVYKGAELIGMAGFTTVPPNQDDTCNHIDEDCDGTADENYVRKPEQPNDVDDDCDGVVDECDPATDWWCCAPGGSVTFRVNQLTDVADPDAAADSCLPASFNTTLSCSLRGVFRRAEQLRDNCAVVAELDPGTHALTKTLELEAGNLTVVGTGQSPSLTSIFAQRSPVNGSFGVIQVTSTDGAPCSSGVVGPSLEGGVFTTCLSLANVSVLNGSSGSSGGGIYANQALVHLDQVNLEGNQANQPGGGVAMYSGELQVQDSIVRHNALDNITFIGGQTSYGAGIYSDGSKTRITHSAIVGNAGAKGGGIAARRGGRVELVNNTISGNRCG